MSQQYPAILLMGPTGAGKSPLGDYAAEHPPIGQTCIHFDFGAQLRAAAQHHDQLTCEQRHTIQAVLSEGRLLTPEDAPIALTLLRTILKTCDPAKTLLVLNGLPRNPQQAEAIAALVNIQRVILLECNAQTVFQRISLNSGGDRTNRSDDTPDAVAQRIARYQTNSKPLLNWLNNHNIPIKRFDITPETQPSDLWLAGMAR